MDIVIFGILWVLLTGVAEWGVHDWVMHGTYYITASNTAVISQDAFNFLLFAIAPIVVFVVLAIFYPAVRFHARRGETGEAPVQKRFNPVMVWTWILVSFFFNVFVWVHPTASGLQAFWNAQTAYADSNPLIVHVYGRQWEWIYDYPQYGISQAVDKNGEDILVLPVNRPVKFILTSGDPFHAYDSRVDVIHSFWIPAFGVKWDVIPGETRTITIVPNKITSTAENPRVRVQCAEVCGAGHPYMITDLRIVSASDFAKWVAWEKAHPAD